MLPVAIRRLEGCVEELRAAKNPVTLRPETMGKSAMLGSLEDTFMMSRAIPGVEPCIDFAHLHARPGDGSVNTYDEWCEILESYGNTLGGAALHSLHAHISGIDYTDKGEKEHLALEDADLDLKAILRALNDFGCRGRLLCESPVMEADALKIQTAWMEITGDSVE